MEFLQNFDSSMWVLQILDQHWLILGFAWGTFQIIAKRTKTKIDDELVKLVENLKDERQAHTDND